jgi:hypothetical protein
LTIVYLRQGKIEKGRDCLSKAIDFHKKSLVNTYELNLTKELFSSVDFELSCLEGQWSAAVSLCNNSLKVFQNSGHRWLLARKLVDLGEALVGRNEPGDLERAREAYQQSLDMITEM